MVELGQLNFVNGGILKAPVIAQRPQRNTDNDPLSILKVPQSEHKGEAS